MGKRHVFRDLAGTLRGYLVQDEAGVRCRVSLAREAEIVLLDGEAQAARYSVKAGAGERLFPACEAVITGGYIADGSGLILFTDERARQAWRRTSAAQQGRGRNDEKHEARRTGSQEVSMPTDLPEKPEASELSDSLNPSEGTEAASAIREVSVLDMLYRRWPPPPCMPGARYDGERWGERINESPAE